MARKYELQAGIFVLITLILLVGSIFILGRERHLFTKQLEYRAAFKDVKGLAVGAPVRMGGIAIGRVDAISFAESPTDPRVVVSLLVNEPFVPRVREGSVVTIDTQGLLGDRFLSISSGADSAPLPPGSELKSEEIKEMTDVLDRALEIVDDTTEVTKRVNDVLRSFEEGTLKNVTSATERIDSILAQLQRGEGFLGAAIFRDAGTSAIDNLFAAMASLRTTTDNLSTITGEIRTGDGLLHDIVFGDTSGSLDTAFESIARSAKNLERASEALASGGGTLGALLVDSKLYDNIVEVTDDAKRSFLLRQIVRRSLTDAGKKSE